MPADYSALGFLPKKAADAAPDPYADLGFVPHPHTGSLLAEGTDAIDAYGGDASARAGIMAGLEGKNPLSAAASQYGTTVGAPTGQDIAKKIGIPDRMVQMASTDPMAPATDLDPQQQENPHFMNPSQVAGAAIRGLASPSLLIPGVGPALKGMGALAEGSTLAKAGEGVLGLVRGAADNVDAAAQAVKPIVTSGVGAWIAHKAGLDPALGLAAGGTMGAATKLPSARTVVDSIAGAASKAPQAMSSEAFKKAFLASQAAKRAAQLEQDSQK